MHGNPAKTTLARMCFWTVRHRETEAEIDRSSVLFSATWKSDDGENEIVNGFMDHDGSAIFRIVTSIDRTKRLESLGMSTRERKQMCGRKRWKRKKRKRGKRFGASNIIEEKDRRLGAHARLGQCC